MEIIFTQNCKIRYLTYQGIRKLLHQAHVLFLLFAFFAPVATIAQTTVTGVVTDTGGTALVGVSVKLQGTSIATSTDDEGKYTLSSSNPQGTLEFTYIGFGTQTMPLNGRSVVNIQLSPSDQSLDEVVVTGYSSQRKQDITGSVAVVNMDALKSIPSGSALQALQGQASGVNVISSGAPGAGSNVFIRGISSFGNTNPLVLVDGVESNLNDISANDIASVQVLKDAGAAAIYGVRGSNGVIVVTTKKGQSGAPRVTYDAFAGVQLPLSGNPLNLLNAEDFAKLTKIANPGTTLFQNGLPDYTYAGPGAAGVANQGDPEVDPSRYVFDHIKTAGNYIIQKVNKEGTDWFHEVFKPAPMSSHSLSVGGGTDKATYLLSLGYFDQKGTMIESYLKRYSLKVNTTYKVGEHIRVGQNAYAFYKQNPDFTNQAQFGNMSNIFRMMPIIPVYDIKGNYAGSFGGPQLGSDANPVAVQERMLNNRDNEWNFVGNAFVEADFLTNFTIRTSLGGSVINNYNQAFTFTPYERREGNTNPNRYSESAGYSNNLIWTSTLTYKNQFGDHSVNVLAGTETIKNTARSVSGTSEGFFSTDYEYLILGNGTSNITNRSSGGKNSLFSLFSRVDYSFQNKYLLGVTVRRDGSSKFGPENRYGVFPSVSLGWRLSDEPFMESIGWLNDLKLRGSYGILGSQHNVNADNSFNLFGGGYNTAYYDIRGTSNSVVQGFIQTRIGNLRTGWEENIITNVGLDATLFNNSLDLSVEYYKKSINGLLFTQPLPATVGAAEAPVINIGDIQNKGFDLSVNYRSNIGQAWHYSIGSNITTYKNLVVKIPDPGYFDAGTHNALGSVVRNQQGHEVSSFYGYQVIGLFQDNQEVADAPDQDAAAPGRFRYKDINSDGAITPDDRTFLGSPNPDFTYGLNLGIAYNGFDLAATLYGSQGNEILNTITQYTHFFGSPPGNKSNVLLNAWTPENRDTNVPKIESGASFSTNGVVNSYLMEDGSFLKLRSILLGYTFDKLRLNANKNLKLRVYLQASNLFTISGYTGLDPELSGSSSIFGVDYGNYPNNQQSFQLGINLTL